MNQKEYQFISSEINELESLLAEIPKEDVISRIGLEERLSAAKNLLEGKTVINVIKAQLTFDGRPVLGRYGILAEFGAKATAAFTDLVAAVGAGLNENLKYMGPIPDKNKNQLIITGTALGSFGFEFELPINEGSDESNSSQEALEKVQDILRLSAIGTDDEIADLVDMIHPRAVKKVSTFLDYLAQQEAWCGLAFKEKSFKFENLEQLSKSSRRLQEDNLFEDNETLVGKFQGVLPISRNFEFLNSENNEVIKGRIALDFSDPDIINKDYLNVPVKANFQVIKFGKGKPRYTILSINDIQKS